MGMKNPKVGGLFKGIKIDLKFKQPPKFNLCLCKKWIQHDMYVT